MKHKHGIVLGVLLALLVGLCCPVYADCCVGPAAYTAEGLAALRAAQAGARGASCYVAPAGNCAAQNCAYAAQLRQAKAVQAAAAAREAAYAKAVRQYQCQVIAREAAYAQAVQQYQCQVAAREAAYAYAAAQAACQHAAWQTCCYCCP